MDIELGTNILRNTNGVFIAHGKEQLRIEWLEEKKHLALSMGVFMPTGTEVARLQRNVWEHNPGDRFVLTELPDGVKVEDTTLKTVVMEIHKGPNQTVAIPAAKFYTSKGTLSEVSPEWWRVGNKMELTGIDTDLEGGGIELPE
ncbi:MAG: hypothetical protein OEY80_00080 [Nitrospirota bacterium]|nr:hypothetical protein [Nitrospirota bacterium]MDH5573858.1 hypothetical protein [Nitrospirota bacterium]